MSVFENKSTSTLTVEQEIQGGENMISESEPLLITVSCVVKELYDDLEHGVSEPWYIKQQLDKLNYYFGLYKTAVFEENTDASKGIELVRDE